MSLKTYIDGDPSTPTPTPGSVATAAWGNAIEDIRFLFDNAVNAVRSNGGALTDVTLNAALVAVDAVVTSLGGEVPPIPIFVGPGEWVVTAAVNFEDHNCFPMFAPQCVFNCSGDGAVTLPATFIVLGSNPFVSCPSFVTVTGGAPILGLQDEIAARIAALTSAATALAGETTRATTAEGLLVKKDGSTPFTAVQTGVSPTATNHLSTKDYVDGAVASEATARGGELTWSPYTPTLALVSGGSSPTIVEDSCRYAIKGKTIFIQYNIALNFSGTPSGISFTLPPTYSNSPSNLGAAVIGFTDTGGGQVCIATPGGLSGDLVLLTLISDGTLTTGALFTGVFIGELA